MAYITDELRREAEQLIKDNELDFFVDLVAYMACGEKTLYNHKLHEVQSIQDLLKSNKILHKQDLRKEWRESDNFNAQKHYYLLIGTVEERDILNGKAIAQKEAQQQELILNIIQKTEDN